MIDIHIRPVKMEDVPFINEMRRMEGVKENILGVASERLMKSENFIRNLTDNEHVLVAEVTEGDHKRVVGIASLHVQGSPRKRHVASLGMMVHQQYQNKKIGRRLLEQLLDLADNWLMLVRIELEVFVDNTAAIKLYQSLGFVIEGTQKYSAVKQGQYADTYLMARYRPDQLS